MPPMKYLKVKSYLEEVAVRPESQMRMPTVRELMSRFNVSLATVNRALAELENDGVIVRRQGSGIVAAGTERTVGQLVAKDTVNAGAGQILFAYNDYPDENNWQKLWQRYYASVNIPSRERLKQMKGYMPVRYWKFMPERPATATGDLVTELRASPSGSQDGAPPPRGSFQ